VRLSFAIIETTDDRSHCAVPFSDQLRGSGARDVGVVEPRDWFSSVRRRFRRRDRPTFGRTIQKFEPEI